MKCKTRQLRFIESRNAGLGEDDRRHLTVCRECREFLAGLESLESELSDLSPPEPPPQVDAVIMGKARARAGTVGRDLSFGSFSVPARIGAVAAVALMLISLWMLRRTPLPKDGDANGLAGYPGAGEVQEAAVEKVLLEDWLADFEQELWLLEAELDTEEQEAWLIGQLWYAEVY